MSAPTAAAWSAYGQEKSAVAERLVRRPAGKGASMKALTGILGASLFSASLAWSQSMDPSGAPAKTTPVGDEFGHAVAMSADSVLVGAPFGDTATVLHAGAAYVFVRNGGVWSEQQKLNAPGGQSGDFFGEAVALSGDTALVGAGSDDTVAGVDAGSAYVFVRSAEEWTLQQVLNAADGSAYDHFGASVALAGDVAVVGAYMDDTVAGVDAGSAYVFVRSGGVWSQQQKITPANGAAGDGFGYSVDLSGDTAVIGAPLDDTVMGSNAGSAHVFVSALGVWSEQQELNASDAAVSRFGRAIAVSGDTAVVGAEGGLAYVFVRNAGTWSEQQKLTAFDGAEPGNFGLSVAVSGETALVGAPYFSAGTEAVYAFLRNGSTWAPQQKIVLGSGSTGLGFGASAALTGDTAVVGAPSGYGSVDVLQRSDGVWNAEVELEASDATFNPQPRQDEDGGAFGAWGLLLALLLRQAAKCCRSIRAIWTQSSQDLRVRGSPFGLRAAAAFPTFVRAALPA